MPLGDETAALVSGRLLKHTSRNCLTTESYQTSCARGSSWGEFNRSMQHEPRMEVSWCKVFARA